MGYRRYAHVKVFICNKTARIASDTSLKRSRTVKLLCSMRQSGASSLTLSMCSAVGAPDVVLLFLITVLRILLPR